MGGYRPLVATSPEVHHNLRSFERETELQYITKVAMIFMSAIFVEILLYNARTDIYRAPQSSVLQLTDVSSRVFFIRVNPSLSTRSYYYCCHYCPYIIPRLPRFTKVGSGWAWIRIDYKFSRRYPDYDNTRMRNKFVLHHYNASAQRVVLSAAK